MRKLGVLAGCCALVTAGSLIAGGAAGPRIDFTQYSASCGIRMQRQGDRLQVRWPVEQGAVAQLTLNLDSERPLLASLGMAPDERAAVVTLLSDLDPKVWITAGLRQAPAGRPPTMSIWNVFFDRPFVRPHQTFASRLDLRRVRAFSAGKRATIALGNLSLGGFTGELHLTFYAGAPLIHVEAVVSTTEDRRAILYDAGLVGDLTGVRMAWRDTEGQWQRTAVHESARTAHHKVAVRHRALIAEGPRGAVACFPPPHQFHFPRDWTDNLKFAWHGLPPPESTGIPARECGFGIRQEPDGKRAFEPWFNAPPETQQRLGAFYLLTRGDAEAALREALRYTRGDRFEPLPGHLTFTSHYHMAVGVNALEGRQRMNDEYARVFRELAVNAVHLGDFHGDGHQRDPGPLRLPEMASMFAECQRLSEDGLLFIPGEELSGILGVNEPGKHPGHWMSLFPKPVYFTQVRGATQPFMETHPQFGPVYYLGGREDMSELLRRERGLAWTAHPRIKASSWTPDIFRDQDFYLADFWLGGAWKAMPADLSRERLGERVLDLLSDMANWGQRKYVPGEVDVFKIDHTHELYGHMNVNYLRLPQLPKYADGWQPILDALRTGSFFVTTGEALIRSFTVGGRESGATFTLPREGRAPVSVELDWTFPLKFAEIISGDGANVQRERIDLSDTASFGKRTLRLRPDLRGRRWVRFEVWDVAANGAFTQPVWLATR